MTISKKRVLWSLVSVAILVGVVLAAVVVWQRQKYAVREGTISGVVKLSIYQVSSSQGMSIPVFLVADDGRRFRLAQKRDDYDTYRTIVTAARDGSRLDVSGRYWRLRKHGTNVVAGGSMYDGPEMTDDPINSLEKADFFLVADAVKVTDRE